MSTFTGPLSQKCESGHTKKCENGHVRFHMKVHFHRSANVNTSKVAPKNSRFLLISRARKLNHYANPLSNLLTMLVPTKLHRTVSLKNRSSLARKNLQNDKLLPESRFVRVWREENTVYKTQ